MSDHPPGDRRAVVIRASFGCDPPGLGGPQPDGIEPPGAAEAELDLECFQVKLVVRVTGDHCDPAPLLHRARQLVPAGLDLTWTAAMVGPAGGRRWVLVGRSRAGPPCGPEDPDEPDAAAIA
jgi:hypothetical protein